MILNTHDEWEAIHSARPWGKWPRLELDMFVNGLRQHLKLEDSKFLDAGCGNGASMWFLRAVGVGGVYGLDISESAIRRTEEFLKDRQAGGCFLNQGDMKAMPYDENFFDCVIDVASSQQNPLSDLPLIFKEFARVLKPGGYLFSIFRSNDSWMEPNIPFTVRLSVQELTNILSPLFTLKSIELSMQTVANRQVAIVNHLVVAQKKTEGKC